VPRTGRFDCHYHDCNEYWLIFKGKAKVMSEGKEYYVKPGDIVCTRTGDEHDVLEVYEDL
jgi:mannose-6-phosphate isomerase-like protein (cupin superfamily)